jgi:very-short-patch-repair endonuclease
LVVELDGGQHAERVAADKQRTKIIENCGYRVLRFWDSDVASNLEGVLERISESLKHPHPNPLPLRGRGDKRKSKEVRP